MLVNSTAHFTATTPSKTTKNPVFCPTYINTSTRTRSHINRGGFESYVGRHELHTTRNGGPLLPLYHPQRRIWLKKKPRASSENISEAWSLGSPATADRSNHDTIRNGGDGYRKSLATGKNIKSRGPPATAASINPCGPENRPQWRARHGQL